MGANSFEGQFKVSRGHPKSNDVALLYRLEFLTLGGWSYLQVPTILKVIRSSKVKRLIIDVWK